MSDHFDDREFSNLDPTEEHGFWEFVRWQAERDAAEWPEVSQCVGVFRIEGPGVQLFDEIEGDHFTVLGMPLLLVLAALRDLGELPT